ncbi:MAG: Nif3-like dinuclear metal center hexameric protein [Clostridia bacterium]|nr:Nif3-like dinuclear metal center hexameric protein [Clostridia bacterium]
MNVAEFYAFLCEKIPSELSLPGDADGMSCCPDPSVEVEKVLIALDVTADVVEEACAEECQVFLAHHPMLFGGIGSVCLDDPRGAKLIKLIENRIAVMSFHTRLDAADGGVSDMLAGLIGVRDTFKAGEGDLLRVGVLERPMYAEEFADLIRENLGAPFVSYSDTGRPIRRVAVAGGSVKSLIGDAIDCGADALVGGEVGYHNLTDSSDSGICLFEAGHFYTENPICARLFELASEAGAVPVITFSDRIRVSK